MKIAVHRDFKKQYKKISNAAQLQFQKRRDLFLKNPFHPLLQNHALHGKHQGYRSINITGDLRVIYEAVDSDIVYFIALGTHAELYG